jgi:hypothetical protein
MAKKKGFWQNLYHDTTIKARIEEAKASESIGQSALGVGVEMLEKIKEINIHTYENLNSN